MKGSENKQMLLDFITTEGLGVVCLQEVTFNNCALINHKFQAICNPGPKKRGTGILVRKDIDIEPNNIVYEPEGRIIRARIGNIDFENIYAPSGTNNRAKSQLL